MTVRDIITTLPLDDNVVIRKRDPIENEWEDLYIGDNPGDTALLDCPVERIYSNMDGIVLEYVGKVDC